jgi:UDP-N-acetylmuramyl pentapeptide synthase
MVHVAADVETAVSLLESLIQPRDIILVKASWGMRLDRIVAALGRDG